jgi:hypothetical protein
VMLGEDAWTLAVAAAARAPSPHNAQPSRWRLRGSRVELHGDPACWLSAGDASGRDDLISFGMAWEAMSIALSEAGGRLLEPRLEPDCCPPSHRDIRLIAAADLESGAAVDVLAPWQAKRRSFRGPFPPCNADAALRLDACICAHAGMAAPIAEGLRDRIARWYDDAAAAGLRDGGIAGELYQWMRFSRKDPRWSRDGLAADCLMLNGLEAWGASWLMRPGCLRVLAGLGLLGLVVSERAKVLSATRLVAIHAGSEESLFECGRRWYRFWLSLSVTGMCAVPMSALVDSPEHASLLSAASPMPPGRRLVNVMRVGPSPEEPPPKSARRPVAEFLMR